jgi:hypothetical protein
MAAARSRAIGLDHRPADVVAAERAEQARKAAAYDAAVSVLEAKLGPSWVIGCPTVADALAEPHTLRVLLGEPHPGPEPSTSYIAELRVTARAYQDACEAMLALWPNALDVHELADAIRSLPSPFCSEPAPTSIDDTTPEGVLALLDAAIDALVRDDEAHLAEGLIDERDGLAFELGGDLRDDDRFSKRRAEQLAARLGLDKPRAPSALDAQVGALAPLDGARLLARFRRLVAGTDEIIANPSDSGWSERQHLTMLAAICLALVAKLTADKTGGAS